MNWRKKIVLLNQLSVCLNMGLVLKEDTNNVEQKLQELIRRGRPQDLVEANRLMKIMSGFVGTRWM